MRGDILDRNGELIVGSKLAPTLYFMPSQNKEIHSAAIALAAILGTDAAALEEKLSQERIYGESCT